MITKKQRNFSVKTFLSWFSILLLFGLLNLTIASHSNAAVTVYAEGAYSENELTLFIYADIVGESLISAGVKVGFDNSKLIVNNTVKNEKIWFMGDGSNNHNYVNPLIQGNNVIFILGKLDVNNPTAGVNGERVLLGKVIFDRIDNGTPSYPDQDTYFGITLDLGKPDRPNADYTNFANSQGQDRDNSVDFNAKGIVIRERGDANGDGIISVADFIAIRNTFDEPNFHPFVDCNNDNIISVADYLCVRNKL